MLPTLSDRVPDARGRTGKLAQKRPISAAATAEWLGSLTVPQLEAMLQALPGPKVLYQAAVGPGDVLYVPSGYLSLSIPSQEDNLMVHLTMSTLH